MDQSVSPFVVYISLEKTLIATMDQTRVCLLIYLEDTRHCDAMDQSVSPYLLQQTLDAMDR